ncbi:MAG TPA: hypothetical protein VMV45_10950 [Casimicrobiaceae bacterium]|nr:hypothetical protein [Casimicrobiaceae bacterium]
MPRSGKWAGRRCDSVSNQGEQARVLRVEVALGDRSWRMAEFRQVSEQDEGAGRVDRLQTGAIDDDAFSAWKRGLVQRALDVGYCIEAPGSREIQYRLLAFKLALDAGGTLVHATAATSFDVLSVLALRHASCVESRERFEP